MSRFFVLLAPSVQHADTGWWQLKYFFLSSSRKLGKSSNSTNMFHPEKLEKWNPICGAVFSDGWLNHQLGHLATHGKAKLVGTWLVSFGTCRMCLLKTWQQDLRETRCFWIFFGWRKLVGLGGFTRWDPTSYIVFIYIYVFLFWIFVHIYIYIYIRVGTLPSKDTIKKVGFHLKILKTVF